MNKKIMLNIFITLIIILLTGCSSTIIEENKDNVYKPVYMWELNDRYCYDSFKLNGTCPEYGCVMDCGSGSDPNGGCAPECFAKQCAEFSGEENCPKDICYFNNRRNECRNLRVEPYECGEEGYYEEDIACCDGLEFRDGRCRKVSTQCIINNPDSEGYLLKICNYLIEHNNTISPNKKPNDYTIKSIENGTYTELELSPEVLVVRLDCCGTGDIAYIDKITKEVIDFSPGDK